MSQIELFGNPPTGPEFTDPILLREFILAGRAKITLKSEMSGQHYTYKITKGDTDVWFVKRLTTDNNYIYLGAIFPGGFVRTPKTSHTAFVSKQFQIWNWFWLRLGNGGGIHPELKVYHEGRCGRCGIELTDPESIKQGYGPECRKKRYQRSPSLSSMTT